MFQRRFSASRLLTTRDVCFLCLRVATNIIYNIPYCSCFWIYCGYAVVTMHGDESHSGPYVHYLLRDFYRQDGKIRHRTMANLSHCSPLEIQAIRLALRH